jgi:uncharacterized membrane protein SirB2
MHAFAQWLQATALSMKIQTVDWVVPLLQSIHILTIGVVFISSAMMALRVLGRLRTEETLEQVRARFSPWLWRGLLVMVITGAILIIGEPNREFTALSFWLKMGLLAIAVVSSLAFEASVRKTSAAGSPATKAMKAAAVVLIAIWVAIIFLGRAIAYDVEIWT